jgi:hypothetical protein
MFDMQNPYQGIVQTLETAYDACSQAMHDSDSSHIPPGKGGSDIGSLTTAARNLLYEALHAARQWHESYCYHLNGGHGHRTDF